MKLKRKVVKACKILLRSKRINIQGELYTDLNRKQRDIVKEYNQKICNGEYEVVVVPCLCGSRDHTKVADIDRYGFWHSVVLCENCGLIYANPRPVPPVLERFYKDGRYRWIYGSEELKPRAYNRKVKMSNLILNECMEVIVARGLKTVFEFGCAAGCNLIGFKNAGLDVYGCDFDSTMIREGIKRGIDIKLGSFEVLEGKTYDIIILSHVIEHFNDFWAGMIKIKRSLSKGGIIYVDLPNISLFGYNKLQNVHNYYFNRSNFNYFMMMLGFKRLNTSYTFNGQDFFSIHSTSDLITIPMLRNGKEKFKTFLKGNGML